MEPAGDAEFLQVYFSKVKAFPQLLHVCHQAFRVAIPQVLFRVDASRQRKHCGLRLLIPVHLEAQKCLDAPKRIPERWRGCPNIHCSGFLSTMDVPLIRGGVHKNDRRELIERISLQQTAKLETADVRKAVAQKN